jgi:hypothetical protein
MKTKREMTLAQALEEIDSATQEIRSRGGALVDGQEFKLDELVTLEVESEAKKKKAELEFEIKFKPASMPEAKEATPPPTRTHGPGPGQHRLAVPGLR